MKRGKEIPKEDLELINKSFRNDSVQSISKNGAGVKIGAEQKPGQKSPFVIGSFWGRRLKYQKSVVPVRGPQVIIGEQGQLWDDIPESLRAQVAWLESDFEK